MVCKRLIIAATGACAITMMVGGAQAAPFGSAATDFGSAAAVSSGFKRVAYRLCWTEGGARQCRWVDNARIYGYRAPRMSVTWRLVNTGIGVPAYTAIELRACTVTRRPVQGRRLSSSIEA